MTEMGCVCLILGFIAIILALQLGDILSELRLIKCILRKIAERMSE